MTRKTTKQHIFRHILNAIFTFNLSSSAVVCWGNNNKKHSKEIKFEVLGLRLLCVPGRERESNEGEIGEIHISLGFNRVRRVLRTFLVKKGIWSVYLLLRFEACEIINPILTCSLLLPETIFFPSTFLYYVHPTRVRNAMKRRAKNPSKDENAQMRSQILCCCCSPLFLCSQDDDEREKILCNITMRCQNTHTSHMTLNKYLTDLYEKSAFSA